MRLCGGAGGGARSAHEVGHPRSAPAADCARDPAHFLAPRPRHGGRNRLALGAQRDGRGARPPLPSRQNIDATGSAAD